MNTLNQITLLLFCLGLLNVSFAQKDVAKANNLIVVIDPGHGGKDAGAIGIDGVKEKTIVLLIAKEIISLNKQMPNSSFDIYLTRYIDTLITLNDRTKLAKTLKADLFISLHCNQAERLKTRGVEVFVNENGGDHFKNQYFLRILY